MSHFSLGPEPLRGLGLKQVLNINVRDVFLPLCHLLPVLQAQQSHHEELRLAQGQWQGQGETLQLSGDKEQDPQGRSRDSATGRGGAPAGLRRRAGRRPRGFR